MPSIARPSPDLSCADLFTSWLPAAYAQARAGGATPPDTMVAVELGGAGGGAWTLRTSGGALTVTGGVDPAAALVLRQAAADFRAAIWGEANIPPLVPDEVDLAAALAGQSKVPAAALAQIKGTLRVEVPGFAGRTWSAELVIGGAATPNATVACDLATLNELRAGTLPPSQAFFTGRIAITGDVPWLMQIGMSIASGSLR